MKEYWAWFLRLNSKRPSGFGMSTIPYSEMESFFNLYGIYPETYEIEVLEMLDRIAMTQAAKEQEKEKQRQEAKNKSKKK